MTESIASTTVSGSDVDPVKVKMGAGGYLWVALVLPLAGMAELASSFFVQPMLPKRAAEHNLAVHQVSLILSTESLTLNLYATSEPPDQ